MRILLLLSLILLIGCSNLAVEDDFTIISHRGASEYAPEHTMPSYEMAKETGADYLEIDLRLTKDKHLVAIHDETVNRTTNEKGAVSEYTLKELKELDAGSWFNQKYPDKAKEEYEGLSVLSLKDIFNRFGDDIDYYIETKNPDDLAMEKQLLDVISNCELQDNVIIQSYYSKSLLKINEIQPNIPLVKLYWYNEPRKDPLTKQKMDELKEYATGVGFNYENVNKEYIRALSNKGFEVHPFTVNNTNDLEMLKERGATGAFTNNPDKIKSYFE
ncbi:glycerophosphodiester phosphodiesterase family protein [Alkalibacillus salilacus]|uniref:Glycerophosphoryl diester phosphodiesterase n=1 Tax=Alkalibacillus salilacus TaxID=284582 RepID=A0ABT9VDA0_9BACI|nr:glycerophosphodiester phosphodiesterase family protein [Alkalibacillus salilacus]MDQ0158953.1 glycerophosphoryl diester phosphodiesterase [Alkalibacillus salilacus]